jgi:secondary thiamine-phosphate synthase enzyme
MKRLTIRTSQPKEVLDITEQVARQLPGGSGLATVHVLHTTTAITTADLDPGTDQDLLDALHGMLPDQQWRHPHNPEHAPAHLLSSIIGPSVSVPYENGQLQLGAWQRIVLIELDGPRERNLIVTL